VKASATTSRCRKQVSGTNVADLQRIELSSASARVRFGARVRFEARENLRQPLGPRHGDGGSADEREWFWLRLPGLGPA